MEIAVLIACLALLTSLNYWFERSVLYPPFLFCLMWLLVFVMYSFGIIDTDPLHATVLLLIGLGATLFSVAGAVAMLLPSPLVQTRLVLWSRSRMPDRDHVLKYVYFSIMLVSMVVIVRQTVAAGLASEGPGGILARARQAGVDNATQGGTDSSSPLTAYMPAWTIYTAILFAIERRNRLFWITAIIAFITAVFTTGRGPILLLFSALTTVFMVQENRTKILQALKFARIPIGAFLALYVVLIFTSKNTSSVEGSVASIAIYYVVSYIVGPVAALDYVIEHPTLYNAEIHHTFKFPLGIATRLHLLNYTPPAPLDSYVTVPFLTNVYTGYKFFYTDFGFFGVMVVTLVIGFFHSLLYRKAVQRTADGRLRSEFGLFCFSCSVMSIIMFIFDDLYSAIGVDLTILLFGSVYYFLRHFTLVHAAPEQLQKDQVTTLA